jgi:uncharacterized protein (DUF58 family)
MQSQRMRWRFTQSVFGFLFVLAAMWYAGSSQQNSAAYLLLFCLISICIISIPHALSNVGGLTARAEAVKPTFAGQEACLPIEIANGSRRGRRGIRVDSPDVPADYETVEAIPAGKAVRAKIRFEAVARGEHQIETVCLQSTFPIGLVRVTKELSIRQRYLVYPKPAGDPKLPRSAPSSSRQRSQRETWQGDDFAGVRAYVPGESQRHIDWKAVARGQSLMTKQFTAEPESGLLYLDFAAIRAGHLEDRLSQLALWIIEAERARHPYGLRLPDVEIPPSLGEAHFHRCLQTLALFR